MQMRKVTNSDGLTSAIPTKQINVPYRSASEVVDISQRMKKASRAVLPKGVSLIQSVARMS